MNRIYQPIYWCYHSGSGLWHWARRRFTTAGLCLFCGLIVAGATGLDIENSVTYQAFALLSGFLLLGLLYSFFFRARFSAIRHLPRVGTAGLPLHYQVRMKNLTARAQTGLTLLEDLADPRPTFDEWLRFQLAEGKRVRPFHMAQRRRKNPFRQAHTKNSEIPPLAPGDEVEVHMEVYPLRRGVLRFAGVTVGRPDPLGIFRSFVRLPIPQPVLILPRRYSLPSLALPGALRYQEGGVALATNIGRSEEFVALREYRHGDPMRHIHWRSWARIGKPIVKEFEDEFFVRHALILDTFDDEPNSEVLEECVSVAASFACTILTQESLLDLLFVGDRSYCFTTGRGLAHADQMLEILASVQNYAGQKFEVLEQLVLNHVAMVSGCICVLQRWDEDRQQLIKKMRETGVPVLVLVVIPPGAKKPEAGPWLDEPANFHVLEIGHIQEKLSPAEVKTPPFLLLAALLFWGWQSGFLLAAAIMGVMLESPRLIRWRWDLDDADFNRLWTFCVLLVLLLMAYVFTNNDEGGGPSALVHGQTVSNIANASVLTGTRFLRWLPMTTFAFIAAQLFNVRDSVPLTSVSMMLRWRRRKGDQTFAGKYLNISYPYFVLCLFSAGIHLNAGTQTYFWGECVLIGWALWGLRSQRFRSWVWFCALVAAIGLGFLCQLGIGYAQGYIQNFDAKWMARFFHGRTDPQQSMTAMGQIGELKLSAQIVIWIEPKEPGRVPAYLREASYRTYRARRPHWDAGTPDGFTGLAYEPNGTSVILLPDNKTNRIPARTTVNISCFLNGWSVEQSWPEGLLPLPTDVRRVDNLPDMVLSKNDNGAVLAGGRGVVIFDATYAPGATIDSPPDIDNPTNRWDLSVSPIEAATINQVVSELDLASNADFNTKLRAVNRFFLSKFTYSIWQGPDTKATNMTPLTRFLLVSHTGHCEYFATATVLILRALHIPARYAVGYAIHETSGTGYVVRERDAHAWCLAWNDAAQCWQDFDTTPSSWVGIESKRTAFWEWLSDIHSWLRFEFAAFRWRQAHLQQYILWALVPMMAVLLFHIIFKRRGKLRANAKNVRDLAIVWPGLDSEFYQLEKKLAGFGLPRQPAEPLSLWLKRVSADPALAPLREPLQKLLRLHYRHRFDPQGLDAGEREQLRREAKTCLDSLLAPRP